MALIVWGVIGLSVFVLLWPAMWVDPVGSLRQVLSAAGEYAAEGHLKPTFFNGEVYGGDPGFFFYPITYLWRTTPVTLIGLALALIAFLLRRAPLVAPVPRAVALILLLYALLFALFMNIGAKKFDRYLLPAYLPLELVAGLGWVAGQQILVSGLNRWDPGRRWFSRGRSSRQGVHGEGAPRSVPLVLGFLLMLPIALQAALALPQFPYYLTYYNPLLGGGARAPEVMMIGWGEGADQAARFLAQEPDAADATVASAYTNGPFSYFYPGETWPIYFWHDADYAVLYAQDRQRRLPAPRQIAYFEGLTPLHTVRLNNIDYAWIYDLQDAPLPAYVTDWQTAESAAPQIRLVSYQFPASVVQPGDTLNTILYFVNSAPIAENLNVIVRLVGPDGTEVAREEGWPWGAATSTWPLGDVWPDGHALSIPPDAAPGIYRLDVAFNNPAAGELLTATQPSTGQALGEFVALDFVRVGHAQKDPAVPLQPVADLGGLVALEGVTWRDGAGALPSEPVVTPGQPITVALAWRGLAPMRVDYTTFVHVVGPDGQALTQQDGQPLGGFFPTSYWQPGHAVADEVTLDVPADAAPGAYAVHVGMYDLATMQRLPITRDGAPAGDSVVVGELIVGDSRE